MPDPLDINFNDDSIITKALVNAVTRAFFQTQVIYTQNGVEYFGGQVTELVKAVLSDSNTKTLINKIVGDISKYEEDIKTMIKEAVERESRAIIIKEISPNSYDFNNQISRLTKQAAEPIINDILNNDPEFKKKIAEHVKFENFKMNITVNVSVTPISQA